MMSEGLVHALGRSNEPQIATPISIDDSVHLHVRRPHRHRDCRCTLFGHTRVYESIFRGVEVLVCRMWRTESLLPKTRVKSPRSGDRAWRTDAGCASIPRTGLNSGQQKKTSPVSSPEALSTMVARAAMSRAPIVLPMRNASLACIGGWPSCRWTIPRPR
jgi:hypothetical protein